ncbi:MAG TPA: hypothetical protein VE487_05540 [Ilumatobacter sp.]|nr:hypothetical protein [Ilumatobacter sp.]
MRDASESELRRVVASAREHEAAQQGEARRLEAQLPALNGRLGAARRRQEHMQRPSTLVTEAARERIDGLLARLRMKRSRV